MISKLDNKEIKQEEGISIMTELGMDEEDWIEIYKREKMTKAQEHNFYNYYSKGLETYFK